MRNMQKGTVAFLEPGGEYSPDNPKGLKPIQVGIHRTKTFQKVEGKAKPRPIFSVPVYKGASAAFARYLRAQRKRLLAGKRCNVTPGYIKPFVKEL